MRLPCCLRRISFSRIRRDARGVSALEFAITAPVLLILFLGGFELPRFIMLQQKIERAANSVCDIVAQAEGITEAQLADLYYASERITDPYKFGTYGRLIISSVNRPDTGPARIAWQRVYDGPLVNPASTFAMGSHIGSPGKDATLPKNFVLETGENVIVTEVFFNYEPVLGDMIMQKRLLYTSAFNHPRQDNLDTVSP